MADKEPMINPTAVAYYDYFEDIEPKLCEYMGMEESEFRAGDKDNWLALLYINEIHANDSFLWWHHEEPFFKENGEWEDGFDYFRERIYKKFGEWVDPLLKAIDKLHKEYGAELLVWYSW